MKSLMELEVERTFMKARKELGGDLPGWSRRQILWGYFCRPPSGGGFRDIVNHPQARTDFIDYMEGCDEGRMEWQGFERQGARLRRKYSTAGISDEEYEAEDRLALGAMQGDLMYARMGGPPRIERE